MPAGTERRSNLRCGVTGTREQLIGCTAWINLRRIHVGKLEDHVRPDGPCRQKQNQLRGAPPPPPGIYGTIEAALSTLGATELDPVGPNGAWVQVQGSAPVRF